MIIAPLIMIEAAAVAGGLSIVQSPAKVATAFGTVHTDTLSSAVTTGNAVVAVLRAVTSDMANLTSVTDNGGGTLTLVHSVEVNSGSTWAVYARMNVSGSPVTTVSATYSSGNPSEIAALEIAGGGSSALVVDASGFTTQATTDTYTFPFTSTVDDVLAFGFMSFNSGSVTATGTSPFETTVKDMGSQFDQLAVGIFPTAGSNTGTVTLSTGRNGGKGWVALRPGA